MPTGYTADVANGNVITFRDYAMLCARAFGATIMMRDEPMDAPIPVFDPHDYNARQHDLAQQRLLQLMSMSPIDAQRECQQAYSRDLAAWRDACDRRAIIRARYQAMLAQVRAWSPPTADHINMKGFMIEQLEQSIDFDCGRYPDCMPRLKRWPAWLAAERIQCIRDIAYHAKEHRQELSRTFSRNHWVRTLRASLDD